MRSQYVCPTWSNFIIQLVLISSNLNNINVQPIQPQNMNQIIKVGHVGIAQVSRKYQKQLLFLNKILQGYLYSFSNI